MKSSTATLIARLTVLGPLPSCTLPSPPPGSCVRYSLIQAAIIGLAPAVIIAELVAAIPSVLSPVLTLALSPFQLLGPLVAVMFIVGLATGWKVWGSPVASYS